jgi:putative FmdB family regulatory protein
MPTYDYHCSKCKNTYELREGFDAPTTHTCQECGKGKAKRVLHAPTVVFKGSGWYVTDSRNKSTAVADSPPESDTSTSSDSKSETKAESKTESKKESKAESKTDSKKSEPASTSGSATADAAS